MSRKLFIIGLIFAATGFSVLSWMIHRETKWQSLRARCMAKYSAGSENFLQNWLEQPDNRFTLLVRQNRNGSVKTTEQIRSEQYERFIADFDKLDNLQPHLYPVAKILYGDNWQQKLQEYHRRQDQEKTYFAGSVIACCVGSALIVSSIAFMMINRLYKQKPHSVVYNKTGNKETPDNAQNADNNSNPSENKTQYKTSLAAILNCPKYANDIVDNPADSAQTQSQPGTIAPKQTILVENSAGNMYTDRESLEPDESAHKTRINFRELLSNKKKTADYVDKSFFSSFRDIKQVANNINRDAKKFSRDVKQAKKINPRQPALLNETLNRLAEEVAAIRSYAGQQEQSVKKLQENHDWNIIRGFALRVIRCIDNLEKRIDDLAEQGRSTDHLEEIRDELLFALESTGLERFEPQLNSDYRGQEKTAEAVKDRTTTDSDTLKGKIADVVRSGYRFVIGEGNFKVVRAAQVRLFG
jgi:molecular chaperone GrpE (heat shock protein)